MYLKRVDHDNNGGRCDVAGQQSREKVHEPWTLVLRRHYFFFSNFKPKERVRMRSENRPRDVFLRGYFPGHGLFCHKNPWDYRK